MHLVRNWQIVLQKSPSRLCEIEICNNRIGASVLLNHCCSFVPDLESMFCDQMPKILLQHNRHKADLVKRLPVCPLSGRSGHAATAGSMSIRREWPTSDIRLWKILLRKITVEPQFAGRKTLLQLLDRTQSFGQSCSLGEGKCDDAISLNR